MEGTWNRTVGRSVFPGALVVLLLLAGTTSGAMASAVGGPQNLSASSQLRIWSPEEVLSRFTSVAPDGARLFHQPDGVAVRLIETTDDDLVVNPGDGRFHPMDVSEVERALRSIPPTLLKDIDADIFILPFPRADRLGSSAGRRAVYLSPGVRSYSSAQVHYVVTHEVGHLFHREHLPFDDVHTWDRYRHLRGMNDPLRFHFEARHADRPQEVFAEDFRVLFGSDLARGDGSIENADLRRSEDVGGLKEFFLELGGVTPEPAVAANWSVYPRPGRSLDGLTLRAPGRDAIRRIELFDAQGRRLGTPDALGRGPGEWTLRWEGPTHAGSYWLRVETVDRKTKALPIRILGSR